MAKKGVRNGTIAGTRGFPGKPEYVKLVEEKLKAGRITTAKIGQQRELIRRGIVLRQERLEAKLNWISSQDFTKLVSLLPERIKTKDVLNMAKTANTGICLRGLARLDKYLQRGFSPGAKQLKLVIPVLQKMLVSRRSDEVKERTLGIISSRNLVECLPFLEWLSAQKWSINTRVKAKVAEVAAKLRGQTAGKQ